MSDIEWRERLTALADEDDATSFLVDDDVRRGRERLRRRRIAELSAGLLVVAVLGGTGLLLDGGPLVNRTDPGPAASVAPSVSASASTTPTDAEPPVPQPSQTAATPPHERKHRLDHPRIRAALEAQVAGARRTPFSSWRRALFATTTSVLDPGGAHLDYSTNSLTAGGDQHGVGLGIKMGWRNPGESGEGMVQVGVTTEGASDNERCTLAAGFGCPDTVVVGGRTMKVGASGSVYVVLHRQPDGERVVVVVDELFGNNSTTAVSHLGFTRRDVYRLVQDDRLDLP